MKYKISKEESIPFREADWTLMTMIQHRIGVVVESEEWDKVEDIEKELELIFNRNYWKVLDKDAIYMNQKKQLNFLVSKLKEVAPTKAKNIILQAKKILVSNIK